MDDFEAIKQLKARYCRMVDTKDWVALGRLFTDDATMDFTASRGDVLSGPDDFLAFVIGRIADAVTVHHCHTPEIDLTSGSTAAAIWAMEDMIRYADGGQMHGYGHYHETYRKGDDGWRIASLVLTRLRADITPPPES